MGEVEGTGMEDGAPGSADEKKRWRKKKSEGGRIHGEPRRRFHLRAEVIRGLLLMTVLGAREGRRYDLC